jgi:basic membrane protein A
MPPGADFADMNRARFALLGAAGLLVACARRLPGPQPVRIGMVSDLGGLGDHSYNDSAYAGLLAARARLHVAIAVLQSRSAADYQPNLMVFASKGYDEVFAIGYDQAPDLAEVAARFATRHFAIVDAVLDAPNVTSVTFKSAEASFLAGALAAMVTRTKAIGFLGGIDVPIVREFEVGYAAGARAVDPNVRVLVKYIGDFDDVAAGSELAALLYGQGADIVYAAAGKAGLGAIGEVRSRSGVFAIGVDADQDGLAPGKILTSVIKRIDNSVVLLATLAAQRRPRPAVLALGLKEHGVGLTDFQYTRNVVTAAMIERLDALTRAVSAGRVVVPQTRAALAAFRGV